MITEDYVSFEVAKLLKEKGFNWPCRAYYNDGGALKEDVTVPNDWSNSSYFNHTSAPTLQMAMKYLRKNGIYIYVEPFITISSKGYNLEGYKPWTSTFEGNWFNPLYEIGKVTYAQSYEDAVEAALKYSLEKLI